MLRNALAALGLHARRVDLLAISVDLINSMVAESQLPHKIVNLWFTITN